MRADIYLDHNATTPVLPDVIAAVARAMEPGGGNPSSLHARGRAARALLEDSREAVLSRLHGDGGELVFTSGGSESNALAIAGVLSARSPGALSSRGRRRSGSGEAPHAVVGTTEHPSTLDIYGRLEADGIVRVTRVGPDEHGRVSPGDIADAMRDDTAIVSLHHANSETGVVQDVGPVGEICRSRGVPFHCDAVQTLGKLELDLAGLGADLITLSAHKVYGPRGVGALWIRDGIPVRHPWGGGPQEKGLRPGTENVPGAAGFASAIEHLELPSPALRDRLWAAIRAACPTAIRNGDAPAVTPNTLNVSFPGLRAETLLVRLDLEGVRASSGSACASGAREPSHVLRAMGLPPGRVESAIRLSTGRENDAAQIDAAAAIIARCVADLLG